MAKSSKAQIPAQGRMTIREFCVISLIKLNYSGKKTSILSLLMSYLNIRITQLYNERFGLLILLILWLLAQLIAYLTFGVRTPIDTELYISDAQLLTHGIWPQERSFWYLSYTLLLAGIHFLGGKPTAIIFIQLLASGFATLAIYKLTQRISNNNINNN